jgi:hypothetical protein
MTQNEFRKYIQILQQKPFVLYPTPEDMDANNNKFEYVDDDQTHVQLRNPVLNKDYSLPLVLVEFANPGVLRLTRETKKFNGSFV